jgi:lantibiotic biosynthesis protein
MDELFRDFEKVFVRTPLYSFSSLFADNDRTINLDHLVRLRLNDPVFLEALYWSSPQLFEAVLKFKEGGIKASKEKKLMQTLKKYLIRASTRCTPYGIYAGTGIADIGIKQENQNDSTERKVRIDMGFMQTLKSAIESDEAIYPHLLYSINNSLYSIPGQYRFMETIIENGACHYQLSSLEHSELLKKIIALLLMGGGDTAHDQLPRLVSSPTGDNEFLEEIFILSKSRMASVDDIYALAEKGTPKEEFNDFVSELIKSQFLVSELQIGLTGGDELKRYTKVLKRLTEEGVDEAKKYLQVFSLIQNILLQFKKSAIGELPLPEIKDLKELLNECGIAGTGHFFHADLKQPVPDGFVFSKEKLKEIEQGIIALGKLGCNPSPQQAEIKRFKKLFLEKYETREIPLSEALDPEFGIGFPGKDQIGDAGFNSLIEKLDLTSENGKKQGPENCEILLRDKIEVLVHPLLNVSIQITEEDLKDFEDKVSTLPATFSVIGSLLPSGKILLEGAGGAPGNSLPGRFAYLDKKMLAVCKEVSGTESEINNQIIFAEIIFIPEGRIGNIARRPILSDYEIFLLTSSGLKEEQQIPVNDLLVSIQNDEIILRSRKLDKQIIPRLSNAHNYTNSLVPAYQFLCALQQQGKCGFGISWGDFAFKKRFLPRIGYKNIIFHRACWFLYKSDITTIMKAGDPLDQLRVFFLKWNVTRFLCFTEADHELFIDTANESYLELLLSEIKTHNKVKLVEWVYGTGLHKFKKGNAQIQQFILPLVQKTPPGYQPLRKSKAAKHIQRTFEPGSEWVYFKIYCGSAASDKILLNVVKPAIDRLSGEGIIKGAFFIRFTDPHYHIRFRLHLVSNANTEHLATVMKCTYDLLHPFCENGLVWKVQLDTYERETERYGEKDILASEVLFFHDSLLYLNCLQHGEFAEDEPIRFFAALKNIDKWLTLFKMSVEEKAAFCITMCRSFSKEYKPDIKVQADLKYRELKNLIPGFLNSDKFDDEFRERDKKLASIFLAKENLASYIHLSLNRWFINRQRLLEYMCYLFCSKYYQQLLHTNQ